MPIFELFSKRQKRLRGEVPDIYTYDIIPQTLKVQVVHILTDAIGKDKNFSGKTVKVYELLYNTLCREYGRFSLSEGFNEGCKEQVINFLLQTPKTEEIIDVIYNTPQYPL